MATQGQTSTGKRWRNDKIPIPSKDELRALLARYTIGQIAIQKSTSRQTVTKWVHDYGLQAGRGRWGGGAHT
ncbi:MAG: hypothetical protein Greene041639_344 [Parcubacteria group bacterium Greene0416_39]|nr:MAG: hypothetical protein Greene041639_344 [Parcubacteria group bacterium Greene0416_39]TSC97721.1 MAG: hypothetical protein Greene101447_358 [Parcubacteria group bacterium Greene1014_47]